MADTRRKFLKTLGTVLLSIPLMPAPVKAMSHQWVYAGTWTCSIVFKEPDQTA